MPVTPEDQLIVSVESVKYVRATDGKYTRKVGVRMEVLTTTPMCVSTHVTYWCVYQEADVVSEVYLDIDFDCLSEDQLKYVEKVAREEMQARRRNVPWIPGPDQA